MVFRSGFVRRWYFTTHSKIPLYPVIGRKVHCVNAKHDKDIDSWSSDETYRLMEKCYVNVLLSFTSCTLAII